MGAQHKPVSFDALLTDTERGELEQLAQRYGLNRRIVLATLARSSAQMVEGFHGNNARSDGALIECQTAIADYRKHLVNCMEQAECAQARVDEVLRQLQAEASPTERARLAWTACKHG